MFLAIFAAFVVFTGTSVAMALQTTSEQSVSPYATIAVTTPDVASAEAAIADEVGKHAAEVERQKKEQEAAAARAATARANTPANFDPGDGSRWDQLAKCECGGNWGCNTGNGFGGGLQFMHGSRYSTWLSFGGGEFAPHPWEATREQQIVVAERVLARSGWGAWPGCSRKFGWL